MKSIVVCCLGGPWWGGVFLGAETRDQRQQPMRETKVASREERAASREERAASLEQRKD